MEKKDMEEVACSDSGVPILYPLGNIIYIYIYTHTYIYIYTYIVYITPKKILNLLFLLRF